MAVRIERNRDNAQDECDKRHDKAGYCGALCACRALRFAIHVQSNDRVERPATMPLGAATR